MASRFKKKKEGENVLMSKECCLSITMWNVCSATFQHLMPFPSSQVSILYIYIYTNIYEVLHSIQEDRDLYM